MKIATVGTSKITNIMIGKMKENDYEIVAVYSRNMERAKNLASQYNIPKAYDDYQMMLNDEEIEFVYIASPNSAHYTQIKEALLKNKNVICEKPLTTTIDEFEELLEIVNDKKLFLFEAMRTYYLPNVIALKNELEQIKPLKLINLNFQKLSSRYNQLLEGNVTNIFNPEMGGGCLMDIGCYCVALSTFLFSKPKEAIYIPNMYKNIDVSGMGILKYTEENNQEFLVNFSIAKDCDGIKKQVFVGENGIIQAEGYASHIESVSLIKKDGSINNFNLNDKDEYSYQFIMFKELYEKNDFEKHLKNLELSYDYIDVLNHLRLSSKQ